MILLYSSFFVASVAAFFLTHSLSLPKRLLLSALIFVIPSLILTFALFKGEDKPLPNSRTITPEELEREGD